MAAFSCLPVSRVRRFDTTLGRTCYRAQLKRVNCKVYCGDLETLKVSISRPCLNVLAWAVVVYLSRMRAYLRDYVKRCSAQKDLITICSTTNRGKSATAAEQYDILLKSESLESMNPTNDPVSSPLLSGRWSLLYVGNTC